MKKNSLGQCVVDEDDFAEALLQGRDFANLNLVTDSPEWLERLDKSIRRMGRDPSREAEVHWEAARDESESEHDARCRTDWFMPPEWANLDVEAHVLEKCRTKKERRRVRKEMAMFRERDMLRVLRFIAFFVDRTERAGHFIGVGRGSSVASYVLFLLGVHKVDSIAHDLPIGEFLR